MRLSIPGLPGVYYDTDAGTTAIATLMSTAGRRAPKPKGYAIQALPYLWSFDVDLHEVPNDHPIQYLHPESAVSLGELTTDHHARQAGTGLESVLRFAWSVNQEVESATSSLLGQTQTQDGVTIEIRDGSVVADGKELETDAFDIDEGATAGDESPADTDGVDDSMVGTEFNENEFGAGDDESNGFDTADGFEDSDDTDDEPDTDRYDTGNER
ncbi:uncharacterized protein Nmag_1534 [Natrialba magadii ATCC 43099]|uniref:Uncharacterized protein n=1 Tax=Natrialba magadii (strain ATCC 43099 / DSM 3394 / CCM 3739 / CIP 104546 / IAM 13178 / JCM 8861 / NBRC 102185 / NCIMB 2190 / MS3) TaxID=547559 RepID=D3STU3_NATMM|nr:hypothetical protein [Natrialba magadii]ADD05110.1 uncharacterized protein Nmag_1534 [Natrialba magadii ATCC 43099]ELY23345.1 hypothetical protein C500_20196 [Natrialba magadii ATCC 43099]